jgi:Zn-dependent metalloprotease
MGLFRNEKIGLMCLNLQKLKTEDEEMMHQCGTSSKYDGAIAPKQEVWEGFLNNYYEGISVGNITAPTAYMGAVDIKCLLTDNEKSFYTETSVKIGNKVIKIKTVDATEYNITANRMPTLAQLKYMRPTKINRDVAEKAHFLTLHMRRLLPRGDTEKAQVNALLQKTKKPDGIDEFINQYLAQHARFLIPLVETGAINGTKAELMAAYHDTLTFNSPVDVLFHMVNALYFLNDFCGQVGIGGNVEDIISIVKVPNMDNAFFSTDRLLFGNGDTLFLSMVGADVAVHELGHWVIQNLVGLIYQGHPGAMNEALADILGTAYEYYIYRRNFDEDKDNDILGNADFLIGEDIGNQIPILRNMMDPHQGPRPSPKKYRGTYWVDPNSRNDYGGVHTNSSVINHLFYLVCLEHGIMASIKLFFTTLKTLSPTSSFIHFRDELQFASAYDDKIQKCLEVVGLGNDAINDDSAATTPTPKPRPTPNPTPNPNPNPNPNPQTVYKAIPYDFIAVRV